MRVLIAVAGLLAISGLARAAEPIVAYTISNGSEIRESLTGAPGDASRGRDLYTTEPRANCPACHGVPDTPGDGFAAPSLSGVGGRLSAGAIRLWIVAPTAIDEGTAMPAYYAAAQRTGADDPMYGGPTLMAAEIEDLVAYLRSLRNPG